MRGITFPREREAYQQNQFGGTLGGPIKKDKLFFFGDYQGTRTTEGLDTGLFTVPSLAERQGNFADIASDTVLFNRCCGGRRLAAQLQNSLGYPVSRASRITHRDAQVPQCVFPECRHSAEAPGPLPPRNLLQYIPLPNDGPTTFSGEADERLRDDKFSFRMDESSTRWGNLSAYYFFDDYFVNNPFPSGQGGANVPGFQRH